MIVMTERDIIKMDEISYLLNSLQERQHDIEIRENELMKKHTSFKIGGPARAMLFPKSEEAMINLCKLCYESEVSPLIMGNGSNVLAADKELNKVVINTSLIKNIELSGTSGHLQHIKSGAGANLASVAVFALENSLVGFEFAHGIPGSIGGAVVMNAGAYGGEMKDVTVLTTIYSSESGLCEIKGEEHEFSYRHSRFSHTDDVIISVTLSLCEGDKKEIKQKMDELSEKRRASQPLDRPSAGSAFKRPKSGYAAELIERAGLKGFSIGDAEVSSKHAGFIINKGTATFDDTVKLIEHVKETVFKQFSITLEPEIKIFS